MRGEPKRLLKGVGGVHMIYTFFIEQGRGGTHKRSKTTWLLESTSTHPSLTSPSVRTHHSISMSPSASIGASFELKTRRLWGGHTVSHHSALMARGACWEEDNDEEGGDIGPPAVGLDMNALRGYV
jgi:hypothetical protein